MGQWSQFEGLLVEVYFSGNESRSQETGHILGEVGAAHLWIYGVFRAMGSLDLWI